MPSRNEYRLNLIAPRTNVPVPQADKNSLNNWITNNIDVGGGDWLTVNLSATGSNPFTHCGCSGILSEWAMRKLMRRLLNLANITPPADFDTYNRRQKRAYFRGQAAAMKAAISVVLTITDSNDTTDSGFDALLAQEGLQRTP